MAQKTSTEAQKKASFPMLNNPCFLVVLILGTAVLIHSIDFQSFSFHPDSKAVAAVCIFGVGFALAALYGLASAAPMLVCQAGNTKLAETLAIWWTKVTNQIGRMSTDHVEAQLQAARICRMNGNYDKSLEFCDGALEVVKSRNRMMADLPEPRTDREKSLAQMSKNMDMGFSYQSSEIALVVAWNYFDKGETQNAIDTCQQALRAVESSLNNIFQKAQEPKESEKSVLTRDFLVASSENSGGNMLKTRLNIAAASTYELLGTAYALENNEEAMEDSFQRALAIRNTSPKELPLSVWNTNYGFALMNLGKAKETIEYCEKAISMLQKNASDDRIRAVALTNLGEAYRRNGDHTKASESLNSSLELKKKLYPSNHPDIAETNHYIGRMYADCGQLKLAREHYSRSIEEPIQSMGAEHPLLKTRRAEMQALGT